MTSATTAREALIVEALGEAAKLIRQVETLQAGMAESRQALVDAHAKLADQLVAFEARVTSLTEKAKIQAVKHILMRTDEAARRSIEQQGRAMADAARAAFGAELGATLRQLQSAMQSQRPKQWERWLTHAAAAATGSAVTWMLALFPWAQ